MSLTMLTLKELSIWDERITKIVKNFGLSCYPQEFEICDHFQMLGYMSYGGMPSRYPHWSYGKAYEREKTLYDYGVGGLPYEMVINSDPCLAYLMRDNSDLLQILTIAHVYGHNDFFANNFTFRSGTRADLALEMFKNHSVRIRKYIADPSIGIDKVEAVLDAAHSLSLQRSRNLAIKGNAEQEREDKVITELDPSHGKHDTQGLDKAKLPLEPEQNILEFISAYRLDLEDWERDILNIVDKETQYFIPQIETKIMNEGWASYWHYQILKELDLPQDLHLEFLVRHNQVLKPTPGGLNPYHLGFVLWQDIIKRWKGEDSPSRGCSGIEKIFEVRSSDRDTSFLRRFLTEEIIRELDLFQHEKRGKDRIVTKVSDEDDWRGVKETLINSIGMGSTPVMLIEDANFEGNRALLVKHEHDGRDLQLEHAEHTLKHLEFLWKNPVILETVINGKASHLTLEEGALKTKKL